MEKEFIPYSESLSLNELGFNKSCLAFYHDKSDDNIKAKCDGKFQALSGWVAGIETTDDLSSHDFIIVAPLYSQAFKFFREKYNLCGWTQESYFKGKKLHQYHISRVSALNTISNLMELSYEEVELECLKKLIQIAKES